MRIRPFFWFLLAFVCASVLTFASIQHIHAPAILQVHVHHSQSRAGLTTFELRFTDPQGLPIDEAEIHSSARMTNMEMSADQPHLYKTGEGKYGVDFNLSMAGPWEVVIHANAPGFLAQQQIMHVEVI
jgi:YtkA-like